MIRFFYCPDCDLAWTGRYVERHGCGRLPIEHDPFERRGGIRRQWLACRLERGTRLAEITAIVYDLPRHRRILYRGILYRGNTSAKLTARGSP